MRTPDAFLIPPSIAARSRLRRKIAAKIHPEEQAYLEQTVKPLLDASHAFVEFVGEVGSAEKEGLPGNARALPFPIDWPEPFGLVMIEALACGTPVFLVMKACLGLHVDASARRPRAIKVAPSPPRPPAPSDADPRT